MNNVHFKLSRITNSHQDQQNAAPFLSAARAGDKPELLRIGFGVHSEPPSGHQEGWRGACSSSGRMLIRRQHQHVNNVYWRIYFHIVGDNAAAQLRASHFCARACVKLEIIHTCKDARTFCNSNPVHTASKAQLAFAFSFWSVRTSNFSIHCAGGLHPHTMEHASADEKVK